jgi:hypothetical protein
MGRKKGQKPKFKVQANDKLTGRFGPVGLACSRCFRCGANAARGQSLSSFRSYVRKAPLPSQNALCTRCYRFLMAAKECVRRTLARPTNCTAVHEVDDGAGCVMVRTLLHVRCCSYSSPGNFYTHIVRCVACR